MHPADIKAAIEKAGTTQAAIARELEVSGVHVWQVVHGRSQSQRVADAISRVTGIPVKKLWPGVYEKQAA